MTHKPIHNLVAAVAVGLFVGCADQPPAPQPDAADEAVFAAMAAANYESVREAFADLKGRTYSVAVETREMNEAGTIVAQSVEQFDAGNRGVRSETDAGTADQPFSRGFLSFLVKPDSADALSHAPLVPKRPAFADLRTREQYSYSSRRDTTVSGTATSLFEARAVVPSHRQPIRFARIGISKTDSTLLYIRMERHDDTVFYEEESFAELTLAHDSAGAIIPAMKYVEVTVDVPFEPARTFIVIESYSYDGATL
ncbi:MAG: hypothetical protein HKN13_11705 [Rhodothermales bacterium]|nr:hypothetical protein [Rhodothermales bacterium]